MIDVVIIRKKPKVTENCSCDAVKISAKYIEFIKFIGACKEPHTTYTRYNPRKDIILIGKKEFDDISNKLKALEIIKEKGLSLLHKSLIISSKNYEEYRQEFQLVKSREFKNEYFYSHEEFGLLKEVLL